MIRMARVGVHAGAYTQLCAAPLYHAAPGLFANMAMQLGHTAVIAERPGTEDWLELIGRHRVNALFAVPTVLHRLLRLPDEARGRYDVSSLGAVVHGAAPCPPEVKRRAIDWLGPVLYEFYAATEGGVSAADSADWLARPENRNEFIYLDIQDGTSTSEPVSRDAFPSLAPPEKGAISIVARPVVPGAT